MARGRTSDRLYFYLRVANCPGPWELSRFWEQISPLGHAQDSGFGTAKDPTAGWFELWAKKHVRTIQDVRQGLRLLGVAADRVPEVVEIDKNEGKAQSKQLDLFGGGAP